MCTLSESIREVASNNLDHNKYICGGMPTTEDKLAFGDFVISGYNESGKRAIGYVVQVREQWGAFGSNLYFVRENDGHLSAHENQSFWKLDQHIVDLLEPQFGHLPPEELADNPDIEYSQCGENQAKGFIVPKDNAPDRVDSCSFAITTSKT